jgi:excisionase family DNA binding protein
MSYKKKGDVTMQADELITVQDLAKRLNVPVSWIYQRTRRGQHSIPHIKLGKYVRFNWHQVFQFLQENNQR